VQFASYSVSHQPTLSINPQRVGASAALRPAWLLSQALD
jgi:hypothetical protein